MSQGCLQSRWLSSSYSLWFAGFSLGHSGDIGSSEASVYIKCDGAESLAKVQEIASEYMSAYKSASWSFSIAGNIFDMVFGNDEPELVARLRPVSSSECCG